MNATRNANHSSTMAANDGHCARRLTLLAQKDDYTEAITRASDDPTMLQCYTNMIQTIDDHLECLDAVAPLPKRFKTSFVSLSSSSFSAVKSNIAANAAKEPDQ